MVVEELDSEVLVYDLVRHRAHCLNQTAALVWRWCDGTRTVTDVASLLEAEGATAPLDVATLAVESLRARELLEDDPAQSDPNRAASIASDDDERRLGRRELLRKVVVRGATIGLAMPLITSIASPTPAQAFSCIPTGGSCGSSAECCGGVCFAGRCL